MVLGSVRSFLRPVSQWHQMYIFVTTLECYVDTTYETHSVEKWEIYHEKRYDDVVVKWIDLT